MRLLHLDVRGFGRLRGRIDLSTAAGDGIGLVLERNEAGKSTLAAALLAALYGLDGDRRRFRGTITDLDRYRPWNEGPFGLALTLERGGETLTVDRDFTRDTVRVLRGSEDVTDRFRQGHEIAVGEGLTGLRKEQFTASVFVGQGDIVWSDPERLTEALQRVADSQSGTSTAASAIEALDRALERYDGVTLASPGKVATEIKRCEQKLDAARGELQTLESRRAELDAALAALERNRQDEADDTAQRNRLRGRRLVTERAGLDELLAHDDELAEQLATLHAEVDPWAALDENVTSSRGRMESLRRRRDATQRDLEAQTQRIREAESAIEDLERTVGATGLTRVPDDAEFDRLYQSVQRLKDATVEHEDFLRRLDSDRRALEGMGHGLPEALSLARDFEELTDADRVLLVGRSGRRIEREERRLDLESVRHHARADAEAIESSQGRRRRTGWILLGVAVGLAIAVLLVGDLVPVPRLALFALPASILGGGSWLMLTARGHRAPDHARARASLDSAGAEIATMAADEADEKAAWSALADRLDIDADAIEARYAAWGRVESLARGASVHRERADAWRTTRTEALEACRDFEEIFDQAATEVHVVEWVDRAKRARDLDARVQHARQDLQQQHAQRQELQAEAAIAEQEIRRALDELDLDGAREGTDLDEILRAYDALLETSRARRELREHRIPSLERQLLDAQRRAAHTLRRETIESQLERLEVEDSTPLSETDHERALGEIEIRTARRREERERLRTETQHVLREYETRAPLLREEIETHERARRAAVEFEAAVTLARDTLLRLGQETHRVWASSLQRTATGFLERMGSDVREIRFDENLGVQLRQHDRVITGSEASRVLSAGALDAVFLAARFAVARFLGGDEDPLPLVLDDPLANADDRRLLETLRLLLDAVAPQQQVLLMACQRSRYEWAADALDRDGALHRLELSSDDPPGS